MSQLTLNRLMLYSPLSAQTAVYQLILIGNGHCTTVLAAFTAGLPGVLF